jgi:hypothetical protein
MPGEDRALGCPQCGAPRAGLYAPCTYCGAKFVRKKLAQAAPPVARREVAARVKPAPIVLEQVGDTPIAATDVRALLTAALAALAVLIIPGVGGIARAIIAVLHDAGHCVSGWIVGHPSFPVVGMEYPGAGAISTGNFSWPLALLVGLAFAYVAYLVRTNVKALRFVAIAAGIWLVFVTADWRRDLFFSSAGHLTEMILAVTFFDRALRPRTKSVLLTDPRLPAFMGFVIQLNLMWFLFRIATNRMAREWYRVESGTGRSDLFVIANHLRTHLGLPIGVPFLAILLLLAAASTLAIAMLARRYRATLRLALST